MGSTSLKDNRNGQFHHDLRVNREILHFLCRISGEISLYRYRLTTIRHPIEDPTMPQIARLSLCLLAINLSFVAATRAAVEPQDFFKAVESGQADQLTKLMIPELQVEIDEPILAVWMKALNERLGKVVSIQETSRSTQRTFVGSKTEMTADVQFERGTASFEMKLVDGKMIAFDVETDDLGSDWFQGPSETKLYQELGAKLIRTILTAQADKAYDMCHSAVHEAIDPEGFRKLVTMIAERGGEMQSIEFKDSRMEIDGNSQMLILNYDITCEQLTGSCEVKIQFIGLKGHLMGFNFQ